MLSISPQNTTDYKIIVTNAATNYFDLVDTASSTQNARTFYTQKYANALQITPEGDIRYLAGATPTAVLGTPLSAGTTYYLPGISLDEFKFISQGGNVTVQAVPYKSEPGESPAAVAFDVTIETGDIEIGAVEIKNHDSDDRVAVDTNNNLATRNFSALVSEEHDYVALSYTGDNLTTVDFKTGGAGGSTVASLALAYTGAVLDSVTKT